MEPEKNQEANQEQEEAPKEQNEEPEQEDEEERGEEAHEEYQESDHDPNEESKEPYDPNDVWALEINFKNKVKSLKRQILERIGLNKKADIVLMKEIKDNEVESFRRSEVRIERVQGSNQIWAELSAKELDMPVKEFADKSIAFKALMSISVEVMGRGQSYKANLNIDPKDSLDQTLKKRTLFWKTFMTKGQLKCVLLVQYDDPKRDDLFVEPEDLQKSFLECGVEHKSTLLLVEFRNMRSDSDDDEGAEGGEEEQEEPEDNAEEEPNEEQQSEQDEENDEQMEEDKQASS